MKCLVEQVQPGLWQISFHLLPQWLWLLSTNCWLWQEPGADELTLIDTGYPDQREPGTTSILWVVNRRRVDAKMR